MAKITFTSKSKQLPVTGIGQLMQHTTTKDVAISTYLTINKKVKGINLTKLIDTAAIHSDVMIQWELKDCVLWDGEVNIKN
jgi:hypothetical protein